MAHTGPASLKGISGVIVPNCSSCGQPLSGASRYCSSCGAAQTQPRPPLFAPVGPPPPPAPRARRPFPGWAVALFVIIALCAIAGSAAFVLPLLIIEGIVSGIESIAPSPGVDRAADVRAGVRTIQAGVETWRADNARGTYPPTAVVTPARLGRYVDPWPVNPCSGGPMQPGGGAGNYDYVRLPGGEGYTLTGYGGDGDPVAVAGTNAPVTLPLP